MSGGSRKQAETNLDVFKWQDDLEIEIVFSSVSIDVYLEGGV